MVGERVGRRAVALGLAAAAAGCSMFAPEEEVVVAPWPPPMVPEAEQADLIVVEKSARTLQLFRNSFPLDVFEVDFGFTPEGHKRREGDGRTPEGLYWISARNPKSAFHLSLFINYPNAEDIAAAEARGEDPGGAIFIHGGNGLFDRLKGAVRGENWTEGCIAVTNADIERIWSRVPLGTPIIIRA
ncbi:MAG: L,D-transpeptidase family protein [Pseudomonadota bacterium]